MTNARESVALAMVREVYGAHDGHLDSLFEMVKPRFLGMADAAISAMSALDDPQYRSPKAKKGWYWQRSDDDSAFGPYDTREIAADAM